MTSPPKAVPVPPDAQRVCIDLPGEEFECYVTKTKVQVMLRKHRDVIFDLQLFKGMVYTVEAERCDFYNARDKKLVEVKKQHKVSFKDGERLHLWVGREFKGALLLKANGKLLGRYEPARLDERRYDAEPAVKPAPLVVVMHNGHAARQTSLASVPSWTSPFAPMAFSTPRSAAEQAQAMHVVEVNAGLGVMPEEVAEFFRKGGEDTAIDADKLITRNWLWAQITGAVAYVGDNLPWIRDLWAQKFYLSKVKGKVYIIFKGLPGLRKFLTGTRYLSDTTKVVAISAGAGTISGVHKAGWEAVKGSMKGAARFALIFTMALDFAEWLEDYEQRDPATGKPKRDFYDLGAKIFTDVAWAVVGALAGTLFAAAALTVAALAGVAVSGGVVAVGAIFVAVGVGYGLAYLDSKLGITTEIASRARALGEYLDDKLPRDYVDYSQSLENMMLGGAP